MYALTKTFAAFGIGAAILLSAQSTAFAQAQEKLDPVIACNNLYGAGKYSESIAACNAAGKKLDPDAPRVQAGVNKHEALPGKEAHFVLDRGIEVLLVLYTKARLSATLGDEKKAHQFAFDAAGWTVNLSALLHRQERAEPKGTWHTYDPTLKGFADGLTSYDPTIFAQVGIEALKRF